MNCDHREEPEAAQPAEVATEAAVEAEPVADAVVGPNEADKALAEQQVTAFCHDADLG